MDVRERDDGEAGGSADRPAALPMFRGVTLLSLDAKGRLAIRARHRDALAAVSAGRLILTADPSRCLLLYPFAAWQPIEARLLKLSSFDPRTRSVQRLLVGHADEVELDTAGRILVPLALRRYAGLERQVMLVGQGHKFEVWDEAQWSAQTAQAIAFPADALPPELDGVSL
jgi:MraZ protein